MDREEQVYDLSIEDMSQAEGRPQCGQCLPPFPVRDEVVGDAQDPAKLCLGESPDSSVLPKPGTGEELAPAGFAIAVESRVGRHTGTCSVQVRAPAQNLGESKSGPSSAAVLGTTNRPRGAGDVPEFWRALVKRNGQQEKFS